MVLSLVQLLLNDTLEFFLIDHPVQVSNGCLDHSLIDVDTKDILRLVEGTDLQGNSADMAANVEDAFSLEQRLCCWG